MSGRGQRRVLALSLAAALAVGLAVALFSRGGEGAGSSLLVPRGGVTEDPFAFAGPRSADFERRAAFGFSHVLYAKSPGGVLVAAERTAGFRTLIEQAVASSPVDADTLEAMVLLESGGRPDVIAGSDPAHAAGLTQILAGTAISFLGMRRRSAGEQAAHL